MHTDKSEQNLAAGEDEPLSMTVHNMPGYRSDSAQVKRGRWMGFFILLACLAPVLLSYFMYYVVKPDGGSSYGELVQVGAHNEMPAVQAMLPDGSAMDLQSLRRQWLLVAVAGGACDAQCEKLLYLQRQIREMTGKDKDRIDRVWLVSDDVAIKQEILPAVQGNAAHVLRLPREVIARWMQPTEGHKLEDHLYVVDPQGRWMMRFPADLDPKKAKRDIGILLKASKSWDRAGRDTL